MVEIEVVVMVEAVGMLMVAVMEVMMIEVREVMMEVVAVMEIEMVVAVPVVLVVMVEVVAELASLAIYPQNLGSTHSHQDAWTPGSPNLTGRSCAHSWIQRSRLRRGPRLAKGPSGMKGEN